MASHVSLWSWECAKTSCKPAMQTHNKLYVRISPRWTIAKASVIRSFRFDCGSQAIGHSPKFQQQHLPLDWFRPSWAGLSARGRPNAESWTVQHSASSEFCWDCQISHSRNVHVFPPHLSPSLHKSPLRQPQKRVPPLGVATHHHQRTTDLVP